MLLISHAQYHPHPFATESELESAIVAVKSDLFGPSRIYLDVKRRIGAQGKTSNIPDGYLIDLSSAKKPQLFVVENELASHDPLRHIAVQILQFSLSFETTQHKMKSILKDTLLRDADAAAACHDYAAANGHENIDVLLENLVYSGGFQALVIIDDLPEELETVLVSRFKFPVEVLTLKRYRSASGDTAYAFDPFLGDVIIADTSQLAATVGGVEAATPRLDSSEIDTIIVPARDEGFVDTAQGENRWYSIRIHGSMIPRIKHIAFYRVAPISAVTAAAPVASILPWQDSGKYVLNFGAPLEPVGPIKLPHGNPAKAPQAPRYTSWRRLQEAKTLDDLF